MHTLPWMAGPAAGAEGEVVIMASRLRLKSLLRVPRFFMLSGGVLRQVRGTPGAVGVSLRADPWRRTFWTLSAWESQDALETYIRTDPHHTTTRKLKRAMRDSLFASWHQDAATPPGWPDADRRLAAQEAAEQKRGEPA